MYISVLTFYHISYCSVLKKMLCKFDITPCNNALTDVTQTERQFTVNVFVGGFTMSGVFACRLVGRQVSICFILRTVVKKKYMT